VLWWYEHRLIIGGAFLLRPIALALIAVLTLGGCSNTVSAQTTPSVPPADPGACAPTGPNASAEAASLLEVLRRHRAEGKLKAVVFDAVRDSKPLLTVALGNSTASEPATTAMHFRVGMPAEQLEATAALRLAQRHALSLDDPVSKWFPHYPHAAAATVRMLGLSSTGFGDYVYGPAHPALHIPSFADLVEKDPHRVFTTAELIRRSRRPYQVPTFDDPGKDWAYSHTNFAMLGSILQTVTSQPYANIIQDEILTPLGMRDTVVPADARIAAPVLHAFTSERGTYEDSTSWSPSWTSYSGDLNSTVCDLTTWDRAFGTGQLLSPASAAELTATTNVGLATNTRQLYFGFGTIVNNGWLIASGNFFGWHTATAYYPPQHLALAISVTESAGTKNGNAINNAILRELSHRLTPSAPITLP
jgi:CubicO group peptidase (beta-lactamase class C family)